MVFGNFQRNLNDFGIQIISHASMESKTYTGIPKGAEGVLILKDMINHELSGKVVADAKSRGLPYALVERKWSRTQDILVKMGFIKVPATDNRIKAMDTKNLVDFILDIRKVANRTATLTEVRKRFPLVTGEEYNVACGVASKHANVVVLSDKEIASYIAKVLAEDYGLVKDEDALFLRTQAAFPDAASFVTMSRVRAVIQDTLSTWKRDRQARDQAIYAFAVSRYRQFKEHGTGWINSDALLQIVKPIFGTGGDWDNFCKARAEVFGPWALRLSHLVDAVNMWNYKHPDVLKPISLPFAKAEIDAGRLKGFKQGHLYRSSVEAIEDYIQARDYLPKPADPVTINSADIQDVPITPVNPNGPVLEDVAFVPDVTIGSARPTPPTPAFDMVGLAELIESGVKIQLDQFTAKMEARIGEDAENNADAVAAIQRDVTGLVKGVTTTVNALTTTLGELIKVVQSTSAEVKALREHREVAKTDPADAKALHLGYSLLNSKGAEVHMKIGDFKG